MIDRRLADLELNLAEVRSRLDAAAAAAGRPPESVRLVAVTKTWPGADVLRLAALGVADVGESKEQELRTKAEMVAATGTALRWHFVGRLQRNKATAVAARADVVHSVDRASVIDALAAGARRAERRVDVLVQVSLDGDPDRGGAPAAEVPRLAEQVAQCPGLRLAGVMAVAPLGAPARPAFADLRAVAERLRREHPDATEISAGMSADLEDAIAEGATLVRVGTAIFGARHKESN